MAKVYFSDAKENIIWSTVILLCVGAMYWSENYIYLLLFWCISFLAVNNVKRLVRFENPLLVFIRRNFYIVPLVLPLIFFKISVGSFKISYICLGFILGTMFIAPNYKNWILLLDSEYIMMLPQWEKQICLMEIYSTIAGAISEELFYRGFLVTLLKDQGPFSILLSAYFFLMHHYRCKWSKAFSKYDFMTQIVFGLLSASLYYYTGNIFISIMMHITFNSTDVILNIKRISLFGRFEDLTKD